MTARFSTVCPVSRGFPMSLALHAITMLALTAAAGHGGRCAAAEGFPRLVIAHHMNAEPPTKAGGQDTFGRNTPTPPRVRPGSAWAEIGGRVRDRAIGNLYDAGSRSLSEEVAWEVAVAKRAGVDAFAFYGGLPGGDGRVLEYMRAAKGTGFKITFCSGGGERGGNYDKWVESMRRLLEADRELDALLRVDGRLLLLSYGGNWGDDRTVESMVAKRRDIEARLGTPTLILYQPQETKPSDAERARLEALLAGGFDGLCPFMVTSSSEQLTLSEFWGDICRGQRKLYFAPISFQFHSPMHMTHAPVADATWRRSWKVAHEKAAGVQLITWNDWGETSALAPAVSANYGLYDLVREEATAFKAGFKDGKPPEVVEDRAWAIYYKYPSTAVSRLYHPPSPRKFRGPEHDFIWVLTALTAPATIVCEGRGERQAPAGRSMVSFPLTPGPVRITIDRDGKTIQTLSPPEVVTDKPWRPDHSLVAFCTDARERGYREQDFPGQAPRFCGEYGDDDNDGLLNWFEGLFFDTLERPATWVGPQDNFNGIPCGRAQKEFLDPILPPPHYPAGFVWSTGGLPKQGGTPAADDNGMPVWDFCYPLADDGEGLPALRVHQERDPWSWMLVRGHAMHRLRTDGRLYLQPGSAPEEPVTAAAVWTSPVAGRIRVQGRVQGNQPAQEALQVRLLASDPAAAWNGTLRGDAEEAFEKVLTVSPGDRLRFLCRAEPPRPKPHGVFLDLRIELLESRMPPVKADGCDPPRAIEPPRLAGDFASALWRNRYRWGEAGLRDHKEGLLIFNPGDRNSREMLAFHDTVPNATYGPLCRWCDTEVRAIVRFEPGGKPPAAWGEPAFAVTTRIAPQRRSMYFLEIDVPSRQADAARPSARIRLGRMRRAYTEPADKEILAEAAVPLPPNAAFTLALSSKAIGDEKVRLSGVCILPDGRKSTILTSERGMAEDGTVPLGEVGFAASPGNAADKPDGPGSILLRSFSIGPARMEE